MNMPIPISLPLRFSQSQRLGVPPMLHRALLCCMAVLASTLLLWLLTAIWHDEAESRRNDARASAQKTARQLSDAHETSLAHAARAERFALVKAVLGNNPPEKTEWEQLTGQLSAHSHIAEPSLTSLPGRPAFATPENLPVITLQQVRIEAGLLHEEALLALDAIVSGSPAHVIPTGCSLRREADAAPITLRVRCEFDWIALAASKGSEQ
jgi:hypothetical protein